MKNLFFKLFLFITLLFVSNSDLLAQVNWTKYQGNPVLTGQPGTWYAYLGMSCVLYNPDSSRYEMWFTAGTQAPFPYTIGYAWSSDGISWNVHSSNPVLTPTPGSWDAYTVIAPFVLRENGQYKMWYSGCATQDLYHRIGYATSPDGINWTKHPSNPVFVPGIASWESAAVTYPCIMPYSNGYKMWYGGYTANVSQTALGYATSVDGITWERYTGNPVLSPGASGQWDHIVFGPRVLFLDNSYYMFYSGEINLYQSDKIGLATSSDGLAWTEYPSNPVLKPTTGQWDGNRIILGSVLMKTDTLLKMYYVGTNGAAWSIGLATSPMKPVSVENEISQPTEFILEQNFPNPFNPGTTISWQLPEGSNVSLKIFNTLGEEVAKLVDEYKPAGIFEIEFNASALPSGVYFYQITAGSFVETKKMILLR